ncbi:MAG: hypothetical protein HXY50_17485 [Ignavibacteriaceae bacterium]|nr:hypothetical protein [Ignavibacteriaceae bacterium]
MSCYLLSLWPVETYSFQNITVYYTGYGVHYPHKTDLPNSMVSGIIVDPLYVYGAYDGFIFLP